MSSVDTAPPYPVAPAPSLLPPGLPLNSRSPVYENQRSCGSGRRLYGFSGYSSRSSSQFILVFDLPRAPASGDVPELVIPVAATGVFSGYFGSVGRWFRNGIYLANSSTAQTLTIGSADTWFDVQYA